MNTPGVGEKDVVPENLRRKIDLDILDGCGRSALFHNIQSNSILTVIALFRADARVNIHNVYGGTPLDVAIRHGLEQVLRMLLRRSDLEVSPPDKFGHTPMWWARRAKDGPILEMLAMTSARDEPPVLENLKLKSHHMKSVGDIGGIVCDLCTLQLAGRSESYCCGI